MKNTMKGLTSLIILFLILGIRSTAQPVDTVVKKDVYYSYYNFKLKSPLYVVYYLYKGGGSCSRKKLRFVSEYKTALNSDYVRSGYQRGHLVNAEDFAFDCEKERCTFSYYNCIPQHPKLNMGSWKSWETTIRNESQTDQLKIYTGGIFGNLKIGNGVAVPDYCWKVVYNTRTKLIMHALLFKNDVSQSVQRVTISQLKQLLGYQVDFNAL